MAEKILQTRIINKHADLSAWSTSSLKLKTGEIALARVETPKPDGHGGFYRVPTYLMKVGDGEKTFSELEWLAAPASDVHEWAKQTTKPSYVANEIGRGTSTVSADLTSAENRLTVLEAALGTGTTGKSVAEMITEAINALDVEDSAVEKQFVTAVAEADGKITVTRRALTADDIPNLEISKINGLTEALAGKATTESVNAILERIDEDGDITEAIEAAQAAADAAQKDIDDYQLANDARVKAIEDDYTTAAQAGTIAQGKVDSFNTNTVNPLIERVTTAEGDIEDLEEALAGLAGTGRTTETVKANADAIALLKEQIGNVANVMNFIGVSTTDPVGTADVAGVVTINGEVYTGVAGDVIIYGEKEYVYDGSAWIKFGDASDTATAITGLDERVTAVESSLAEGGATYEAISDAAELAQKGVDDAATAKGIADKAATDIQTINGEGVGSIKKAVADATTELQAYADQAEADAITAAKAHTDKLGETVTALSTTVETNKTEAAAATKKVADDLAAYETSNNAAVEKAQGDATQAIADAAAALKHSQDLASGQVNTNKEGVAANAASIETIQSTYAKVKTVEGVGSTLVVGASEDVIIFDCGGVNELA